MVPYWVREPIGRPRPFFISSTPAITVVITAPIPGRTTPGFPRAGAIVTCPCSICTLLWSIGRCHHNTSGETASQERSMIEQVTQVCKQAGKALQNTRALHVGSIDRNHATPLLQPTPACT